MSRYQPQLSARSAAIFHERIEAAIDKLEGDGTNKGQREEPSRVQLFRDLLEERERSYLDCRDRLRRVTEALSD